MILVKLATNIKYNISKRKIIRLIWWWFWLNLPKPLNAMSLNFTKAISCTTVPVQAKWIQFLLRICIGKLAEDSALYTGGGGTNACLGFCVVTEWRSVSVKICLCLSQRWVFDRSILIHKWLFPCLYEILLTHMRVFSVITCLGVWKTGTLFYLLSN